MSTVSEDMRKALNKAPFADPFVETFDPATDSLEAIKDSITGLESGIYTYCSKSGPTEVEINDEAEFSMELLNPGDVIIPTSAITPGNYKIDRIRDGAVFNIVPEALASEAPGRIYCTEKFEVASGWAVGDLIKITFSGGSVSIGGVTTAFPIAYFYGRIVRDEAIYTDTQLILGDVGDASGATLGSLYGILGNPPAAQDLTTRIGYEGATSLASKLTLARAGYLDQLDFDLQERLGTPTGASLAVDIIAIKAEIDNTAYGLNALHGDIGDKAAGVDIITRLGAFTTAENLKAILGNLASTKQLGQILGALTTTNNLYTILGAADAVSYPIATDTKYLSKLTVTGAGVAESIANKLDLGDTFKPASDQYYTATRGPYLDILNSDSKYILTNAIPAPTVNSLARFIASGGTALGTVLFDSLSIIDALGHNGNAILTSGLGTNIGNFQARGNQKSILDMFGFPDAANGSLYNRLGLLTNTDNLFTILGGYTAATHDTLKEHVNSLVIDDLTAGGAWHDAKSIAGFVRNIGVIGGADSVDSAAVVVNEVGSVFERLEHLKSILDDNITDDTHTITVAHAAAEQTITTFTAHRVGELAVELDLNALIGPEDTKIVTVRLKHMIDNATARTIDIATFVVGTDEIHPSLSGWVDTTASGVEVTIQMSLAVAANRDVPYKILEAC